MKKPYFVMMYSQDGEKMMPLVGNPEQDYEDDDPTRFETEEEARYKANRHPYASSLGYEVFSMDDGL